MLYKNMLCYYFLLTYNCFTKLCLFLLHNNMNELNVYINPLPLWKLPLTHSIPPLQVTAEHQAELLVLYSWFPLAVYTWVYKHMVVYICQGYCLSVSLAIPPPTLCLHVHSLSASLFLPCEQFHLYHLSRFHAYV